MQPYARVELALEEAVARAGGPGAPPMLAEALRYSVFPGGHRIRPQIVLAVARACGDGDPSSADAAAAAIELLHCASLVHDDLPAFDNADLRRGKPSVHLQFGEPLAVLSGDALIVLAFETLAMSLKRTPLRLPAMISIIARAVGGPSGIVAGQAWECETAVPLSDYQRAKTGALFVGSTLAGALAAGYEPEPWRALGEAIGEAYQVADDLRDVLCDVEELGKPIGQDARRMRPNAAAELGVGGAKARLRGLVDAAVSAIPDCPGIEELRVLVKAQTTRFFPKQLAPLRRLNVPAPAAAMARPSGASLGERWLGWRNRLFASPRFQRWAAAFPPTRSRAGREARALFDLCAGFVYSQVLSACVRLDLFERLRAGARDLHSLAPELGLTPEAARRLFRAAASLRLLESLPGDRFALGPLGAAMLGNPSIADFVRHHELLYDDLRDPVALLRGEATSRLSTFWPYAGNRPGGAASGGEAAALAFAQYSDLMSRSQALIAEDLLDAYPARSHRCWLDVGGGEGAFIAAAAKRAKNLRFQLFDLPPVAARARAKLAAEGLESRVAVFEGNFLDDALPQGADLLSLVRIVHDHDDESARALLTRAFAALAPGGTVLIAEPMAETPGGEPIGDAYFGFYLLAMGRGRARPPREIFALLESAGFSDCRLLKTRRPMLASAVSARRL